MPPADFEREQEEAAAAEAAAIGGRTSSEGASYGDEVDEAQRPLDEAGQGEAEGFEQAERALMDHASHGDQHAARRVIEDAPAESEDARAGDAGQADFERSSEREEDLP